MWRRMASVWPICSVWHRYSDARELSRHSWSVSSHARMPSRTLRSKSASVTTQVSSSSYICVLILLYKCPQTAEIKVCVGCNPGVRMLLYVPSCCHVCVRILLLYMFPHSVRTHTADVSTQREDTYSSMRTPGLLLTQTLISTVCVRVLLLYMFPHIAAICLPAYC
jgi:hypothetical protein